MKDLNEWKAIYNFLKRRATEPANFPSYVLYFIVVVVIIGSIGFLTELLFGSDCHFNYDALTTNAANIFISFIAASSIELVLINDNDEYLTPNSSIKGVQLLGISFLIFGLLLWMLIWKIKGGVCGLSLSLLGMVFSYALWWISNAGNKTLIPDQAEKAPVGGEIEAGQALQGSIDEFETSEND